MLPSKALLSAIEHYLLVIVYAVCHLIRYIMYLPSMMIVVQSAEELKVACSNTMHIQDKVKMIKLSSYNVRFKSRESA